MLGLRIRNALLAAVGLLLPLVLSWAVLVSARDQVDESGSSVKTPNPAKAPAAFLSPTEVLVYHDPWFAGVFGVVFYPWCAVYAGAIAATAALRPARLVHRPLLLFAITSVVGAALATPWLYFAARTLLW